MGRWSAIVSLSLVAALGCPPSGPRGHDGAAPRAHAKAQEHPSSEQPAPPPDRPAAPVVEEAADAGRPELDGRVGLRGSDGDVSVRVEVVKTSTLRTRGLMFRRHLDDDAGMLFLFRRPEHQSFWMRNTLIPLDMLFIGADRRVVGVVENAEPETLTSRAVEGDSQYVLEVNAGFARRHGIGPGTRVEFAHVDETGVDP